MPPFTDLSIRSVQIIVCLACAGASSVLAHSPMQLDCIAPSRPADDQNDVSWQKFLGEIDAFQGCISADTQRQQEASKAHQEAARAAVERWNQFVRTNLNVPEDFPFVPESD